MLRQAHRLMFKGGPGPQHPFCSALPAAVNATGKFWPRPLAVEINQPARRVMYFAQMRQRPRRGEGRAV